MNNWQKLCEIINYLIRIKVVDETPFHNAFELELKEIFQWDDSAMKHKPPVKMGTATKYADIVLEGIDFGIIIEIKRPAIEFGYDQADQLISYMDNYYCDSNNKKCNYGLLVGGGITFFYRDAPDKKPQEVAGFGFNPDNSDGIALGNILTKGICSNDELAKYAKERIEQLESKKKIEELKKGLFSSASEKIKNSIQEKLLDDGPAFDRNNLLGRYKNIIYQQTASATVHSSYNKKDIIRRAKELFVSDNVLGSQEDKNRAIAQLPDDRVLDIIPIYHAGFFLFTTPELFLTYIHEYGGFLPANDGVIDVFASDEHGHYLPNTTMRKILRKYMVGNSHNSKEWIKASDVFYDIRENNMNGIYTVIYDYSIPSLQIFSKRENGHTSYYANGFPGFRVLPMKPNAQHDIDLLAFLANHINMVICNNNLQTMYCVWCFLADMFQNPSDRPAYALVVQGDKGNGKSQIFDVLLRNIMGSSHFHIQAAKEFSKWNKQIVQSLFTNIDEWVTSEDAQTDLRTLITAKEPNVREKNEKERRVRTYSRIVITCNNDAHIVMEPTERRFNLLQTNNDIITMKYPAGSVLQDLCMEYMAMLDKAVNSVGSYFLDLLLSIDTSKWNKNVFFKTEAALQEQANVRPMFQDFLTEEIDNAGTINSCMSSYEDFIHYKESEYSRPILENLQDVKNDGGYLFFTARVMLERYSKWNQRATMRSANHDLSIVAGNKLLKVDAVYKNKGNKTVRDTIYSITRQFVNEVNGTAASKAKPPPQDMTKLPIFKAMSDDMRENLALFAKITTANGRTELSIDDNDR